MPLCRSNASSSYVFDGKRHDFTGCPIQQEAQSPSIARLVSGFCNYKNLNNLRAPQEFQIAALKNAGCDKLGPDFILEMEKVQAEYEGILKDKRSKEAERKRKAQESVNRQKDIARKMR